MKNTEEEAIFYDENPLQETDYVDYHDYLIRHTVSSNIYILPIQHMDTIKINIKTAKEILYNLRSHKYAIHICAYMNNQEINFLDLLKEHFTPKTMSMIEKCLNIVILSTLSAIWI